MLVNLIQIYYLEAKTISNPGNCSAKRDLLREGKVSTTTSCNAAEQRSHAPRYKRGRLFGACHIQVVL